MLVSNGTQLFQVNTSEMLSKLPQFFGGVFRSLHFNSPRVQQMPSITVLFGALLCGLSVFTAVIKGDGFTPGTWLIPAGFGIVLIILGAVARSGPGARKHAMHGAALVGTLGAIMSLVRGIPALIQMIRGGDVNLLAFGMVWAMAIICLTFVFACVQSFVAARKAREAAEKSANPS